MSEAEIQAVMAASLLSEQEDESRRQAQEAALLAQLARNAHLAQIEEAALAEALAESERLAQFEEEIRQAAAAAAARAQQQQLEAEAESKEVEVVAVAGFMEPSQPSFDQLIGHIEVQRIQIEAQRERIEELEAQLAVMKASTLTTSSASSDFFDQPRPAPVRRMPLANSPASWVDTSRRTLSIGSNGEVIAIAAPEFQLPWITFSAQELFAPEPSAPFAPSAPSASEFPSQNTDSRDEA